MILQTLREQVLEANLEVVRRGLVLYTFGNASGIDRDQGIVAIKPSGVPYETLRASDIVLVDLEGRPVQGALRPSSDLPTHLVLYRAFASIGGIVHTHSRAATSWAQAGREIPCLGTTHADYFHGPVPVTRELSSDEIADDYETNTGNLIVRQFAEAGPSAHTGGAGGGARALLLGRDARGSGAYRGDPRRNRGDGAERLGHQPAGRSHPASPARQTFFPQAWPWSVLWTKIEWVGQVSDLPVLLLLLSRSRYLPHPANRQAPRRCRTALSEKTKTEAWWKSTP